MFNKQTILLRSLIKNTARFTRSQKSSLVLECFYKIFEEMFINSDDLIEIDLFHVLVSITFAYKWDLNLFRFFYQTHLIQILYNLILTGRILDESLVDANYGEPSSNWILWNIRRVVAQIVDKLDTKSNVDLVKINNLINPFYVLNLLKQSSIKFLRCSAIFFSNLYEIVPTFKINNDNNGNKFLFQIENKS